MTRSAFLHLTDRSRTSPSPSFHSPSSCNPLIRLISSCNPSRRSCTSSRRLPSFRDDRYASPRTRPAPTRNKKDSARVVAPFWTAL